MSLPAGEARQSHIILQVRTINGSDFELIVFPNSTATYRRSFPYPARVEGSARIFAASLEGGIPRPVGMKGALLALMNKCQEALAEPVSEKTVVDYLVSLQSSYETVQACLIGSMRNKTDMPDQQEG